MAKQTGKRKDVSELLNMQTKEVRFLIAYFTTANKTDAYRFIQDMDASDNDASVRAMASAYSKKPTVQRLEPAVKSMYLQSAIKLLEQDGYKVLNPKEATEYIVSQLNAPNTEQTPQPISTIDNENNVGAKKNTLPDPADTEQTEPNQTQTDNTDADEEGKGRKGVDSDNETDNFSPDPNLPDYDLSNKDDLLKELQSRYKIERDPKVKNEIAKMIIDVQQMKKQDIVEQSRIQKVMYLPLRKCENCPELHTLISKNS